MIKLTDQQINHIAQDLEMGMIVFIHKKTGIVNPLIDRDDPHFDDSDGLWDESYKEIDDNKDDFITLKKMESRDEYRIMENFVETVSSRKNKDRLYQALNGHKPFRNFKHQVDHMGEVREQWFKFRTQTYMNNVKQQLSYLLKGTNLGIENPFVEETEEEENNILPSYEARSIRTFIGAKNFDESRTFYQELGFTEVVISDTMSLFKVNEEMSFYLQKYYVKDWINNSMIFLEVDDVDECYQDLERRGLHHKYKEAKLSPIKKLDWGRECFLHDPSGVLWHFGEFRDEELN